MKILVANVGSTSFKYRLFDMTSDIVLAEGRVERIGSDLSPVEHRIGTRHVQMNRSVPDYPSAVTDVIDRLLDPSSGVLSDLSQLDAVGFKTVHLRGTAGTYLLTDDILARMADYNDLAPAHNPPYIQTVRIFGKMYPDLPLVGLFEAAFHTSIPDHAYTYGVPYEWYEKYGVRKYGFHGASHRYVSERVQTLLDRPVPRLISCHLGGSSSLCAIRNGKSIDTSMGFSPQEGILNSTRNGHLDPFIIPFIMDREGLTTQQVRDILTRQSGLLGISGISGDMRDLLEAEAEGNDRARLAVAAFCYGVTKEIGALAAALGGLDALAFAGGIGERGAEIRARICHSVAFLGVDLDPAQNGAGKEEGRISPADARVPVLVIRTDEERIVAQAVTEFLENQ